MREPFASMLATRAGKLALSLLLASPHIITPTTAYNFTSIPSPNLNLDDLGRVAFAGEFDSISVYQFEGQSERSSGDKGALLSRYPTGAFANINNTDADIKAMCAYQTRDGERVVFAGNFTSVGGFHTPGGIALLNPYDGTVEPLEGLNGSVNALFCDRGRGQVYVGGSFTGSNSSNALIWKDDWIDMPFEGFNGPVFSITQAPNDKIVFGGLFNGLGGGNASGSTAENITQIIPISSANISAQTSSGRPGFTQPSDIVCKDNLETQGADQTWLLSDNVAGFWKADFGFGFEPSKLRLYNTDFEGRGTKTWRYTALPDGGIMNFTFIDPATGQQSFCDARCPLPQGNTSAQDFTFVNTVGMNSFRIDISDWYGSGGGLNGIQLFQNETFAWAIDDFNAPRCGGPVTGAQSTATGPWLNTPSHDSNAQYLTAVLQGDNIQPDAATVVFQPEIKQSGNYSVTIYTPGCIGDGTCGTRGRVNVTGAMAADRPTSTVLFQTNDFDKYDEIYYGFIDATNGFRPTVTLAPAAGQSGILTMVAQRVRFSIKNATSGDLNGLFEYDTSLQEGAQIDLSSSVINSAGVSLNPRSRALVTTLAADNDRLYVGGNFTSGDGRNNIFAIGRDATSPTALSGNGLNSQVMALYQNDSTLYVGGNFTNTEDNNAQELNGLAAYSNNQWTPIGAGVNGVVMYIVPFSLNLTAGNPVQVLGISGFFDRVNGFDNNPAFDVEGFAIWIPSQNNWLNNLNISSISVRGKLMTHTDVPGSDPWFGGSVSSGTLGADGAVVLNDDDMSLQSFPAAIRAQQQQSALRKRAIADSQNLTSTGILAATFYKENGMNKTILAGHFSATGSDNQNITNVMIIDGKDSDKVTGFDSQVAANSTFGALAVQDNILYAGGVVSGQLDGNTRIGGVVAYDLSGNAFASIQPPALQGTNVTVNAIAPRPKSKDVFIAGRFESAGALSCPALCIWNTERNQWTNPGGDIRGIVSALTWVSDTKLFITGNLTTGNNQTKVLSYDSSSNEFLEIAGANDLPGPVSALTPATSDGNQVWASGQTADGSAFLQRFDGEKWLPVNDLFGEGTIIRGIQVLTLSDPHGESDLIDRGQDLLLLGQINVTDFGTASGVLFNGTALIPILLSTTAEDTAGTLSQVFVENPQFFLRNSKKHLALGFIVLIALGIALALTFLLVVAGIVIEWYRKKAKGYSPAPTNYPDRLGNVGRVPPEQLFGTLRGPGAPTV